MHRSAIQIPSMTLYRPRARGRPRTAGSVILPDRISFSISLPLLLSMISAIPRIRGRHSGRISQWNLPSAAAAVPSGIRPPMTKPETASPKGREAIGRGPAL